IRRGLVLREDGLLVFPSQWTKENRDLPDSMRKTVVFEFEGPVLNIYTTLAVRLARSGIFKKQDLWKDAGAYTTSRGRTCGVYLRNVGEGRGELRFFFDQAGSLETRDAFTEYVHLYLSQRVLPTSFKVRYIVTCNTCNTVIPDNIVQLRKKRNFNWLT